ncbi:MAG: hypothetical protein R3F24_07605 [Gammaproteobacteria bacterium]
MIPYIRFAAGAAASEHMRKGRHMKKRCIATMLLALTLGGIPSYAATVNVVAIGQYPVVSDPLNLLPFPHPSSDTKLVLSFSYESATVDSDADPHVGLYVGAISNITLSIGETTLPAYASNKIDVYDDRILPGSSSPVDVWAAETFVLDPTSNIRTNYALVLLGSGGSVIDSDELTLPVYPARWRAGYIWAGVDDASNPDSSQWVNLAGVQAGLESIQVTVVPLPPTSALLATGLLAIGRKFLKRSRQSGSPPFPRNVQYSCIAYYGRSAESRQWSCDSEQR